MIAVKVASKVSSTMIGFKSTKQVIITKVGLVCQIDDSFKFFFCTLPLHLSYMKITVKTVSILECWFCPELSP